MADYGYMPGEQGPSATQDMDMFTQALQAGTPLADKGIMAVQQRYGNLPAFAVAYAKETRQNPESVMNMLRSVLAGSLPRSQGQDIPGYPQDSNPQTAAGHNPYQPRNQADDGGVGGSLAELGQLMMSPVGQQAARGLGLGGGSYGGYTPVSGGPFYGADVGGVGAAPYADGGVVRLRDMYPDVYGGALREQYPESYSPPDDAPINTPPPADNTPYRDPRIPSKADTTPAVQAIGLQDVLDALKNSSLVGPAVPEKAVPPGTYQDPRIPSNLQPSPDLEPIRGAKPPPAPQAPTPGEAGAATPPADTAPVHDDTADMTLPPPQAPLVAEPGSGGIVPDNAAEGAPPMPTQRPAPPPGAMAPGLPVAAGAAYQPPAPIASPPQSSLNPPPEHPLPSDQNDLRQQLMQRLLNKEYNAPQVTTPKDAMLDNPRAMGLIMAGLAMLGQTRKQGESAFAPIGRGALQGALFAAQQNRYNQQQALATQREQRAGTHEAEAADLSRLGLLERMRATDAAEALRQEQMKATEAYRQWQQSYQSELLKDRAEGRAMEGQRIGLLAQRLAKEPSAVATREQDLKDIAEAEGLDLSKPEDRQQAQKIRLGIKTTAKSPSAETLEKQAEDYVAKVVDPTLYPPGSEGRAKAVAAARQEFMSARGQQNNDKKPDPLGIR